jgi:ribosomal-protein-alanine N-acetyltransferase
LISCEPREKFAGNVPAPPRLETPRLLLRPFMLADAPAVMRIAGSPEVARTTLLIPHPYPSGMAEDWIGSHESAFEKREHVVFAIALRDTNILCGAIGLTLHTRDQRAELGYWLGPEFWNRGYCTEAASAVLRYGFETLKLHRIHAGHFQSNTASGCVLEKIGMRRDGVQHEHHLRFGEFQTRVNYGILSRDWKEKNSQ